MKALKALGKINTFALSGYLIYFILGYNDFFISKEQTGVVAVALVQFFTTFICGGITLVYANKADISNEISFEEIKSLPKSPIIFWAVICLAEIITLLLFYQTDFVIWCIATLVISYFFTLMVRIVVPKIKKSSCYKMGLPWYVYPLPFIIFLGGNIYASDILPENIFDKVAIIIFIISGILLVSTAWHGYYIVDENEKTIEKNLGIISEFRKKKDITHFSSIKYVEKKGLFYIINTTEDRTIKISRLYSDSKRFKETMTENAIIVSDKSL